MPKASGAIMQQQHQQQSQNALDDVSIDAGYRGMILTRYFVLQNRLAS